MPSDVVSAVLSVVLIVLLLNLVVALVVFSRRSLANNWLLVILLAGTSGAALAGILAVLAEDGRRFADVALVLTGTAAVTAAVRAGAERRRLPREQGAYEQDEHEQAAHARRPHGQTSQHERPGETA